MPKTITERSTLFSTLMVQLAATGQKTTVRQVLKDVPDWIERFGRDVNTPDGCISGFGMLDGLESRKNFRNIHGEVGDRLWVRESWRPSSWDEDFESMMIEFKAGGLGKELKPYETWDEFRAVSLHEQLTIEALNRGGSEVESSNYIKLPDGGLKWRPATSMPRNACRNFLKITETYVEKLLDITKEDAIAEGARYFSELPSTHPYGQDNRWSMENPTSVGQCLGTARFAYLNYWNKANANRDCGSSRNPWVRVINFEKCEANH